MFSKRPLPEDARTADPAERLRANLADLFLSNQVSGQRAQSVFADVHANKVSGFKRLAKAGKGGRGKHVSRDLRRTLAKTRNWPKPYLAKVRVWDKKAQRETLALIAISLPHELLAVLISFNSLASLLDCSCMTADTRNNFEKAKGKLQEPQLIALGLWADGCPCNWDRSESLEMWSLSFPGVAGWEALRLPLTLISKKFLATTHTFDDILKILQWSFDHMLLGRFPQARHDGTPFGKHDAMRKRKAGKDLGGKAILVEVRGDWKLYKDVFRLPGWNSKIGCCYRCRATPVTMRDTTSTASWRSARLSHWDLLSRIISEGKGLCPIFSFPGFDAAMFAIDWLHCADIGVSLDWLGNLFWAVLSKYPGASKKERCSNLWLDIQAYYATRELPGKLDNLTLSMIKAQGKGPKLRARAGEARGLIEFACQVAESKLSDDDVYEHTIKLCAKHLHACYDCLSRDNFSHEIMAANCKSFCTLYIALSDQASNKKFWRVKPKLHMFQELCEMSGDTIPSMNWCYRDEDFGGGMAAISRRRGGKNSPSSTSLHTLQRFYAKHQVPVL